MLNRVCAKCLIGFGHHALPLLGWHEPSQSCSFGRAAFIPNAFRFYKSFGPQFTTLNLFYKEFV